MKISKLDLIDQLIPQVIESFTHDDLVHLAEMHLDQEYQSDFDMLVEDALTFNLIQDEEDIE